jgi:hypothetical protein
LNWDDLHVGDIAKELLGLVGVAHEHAHRVTGVEQALDDCAADPSGGAER